VNNIPPGAYRVRVSMVGYGTVVYENVRINVDMTTELNALLPSEVISLDKEIVVTARGRRAKGPDLHADRRPGLDHRQRAALPSGRTDT